MNSWFCGIEDIGKPPAHIFFTVETYSSHWGLSSTDRNLSQQIPSHPKLSLTKMKALHKVVVVRRSCFMATSAERVCSVFVTPFTTMISVISYGTLSSPVSPFRFLSHSLPFGDALCRNTIWRGKSVFGGNALSVHEKRAMLFAVRRVMWKEKMYVLVITSDPRCLSYRKKPRLRLICL